MRLRGSTLVVSGALFVLAAGPAAAAPTFSVDFHGPTARPPMLAGRPDSIYVAPITDCDILSGPIGGPPLGWPGMGPLGAPGIVVNGSPVTIPAAPIRTLALAPTPQLANAELDALSYGRDTGASVRFSVDEYAFGNPIVGPVLAPNVFTEGPGAGFAEACADVFGLQVNFSF